MLWSEMISSINDIEIMSVIDLDMYVGWNDHAFFNIEGTVSDKNRLNIEKWLYDDGILEVKHRNQDGECKSFFCGYIKLLKVGIKDHNCWFKLSLTGISNEMDRDKKTRIFQEKNMSYEEVINTVIKPYGFNIISEQKLQNSIEQILVQYNESDWEFLKRVVSHLNVKILGNYRNKNKYLFIGVSDTTPTNLKSNKTQIISNMEELQKKQENGLNYLLLEDGIDYVCHTNLLYDVGSMVTFEDKLFCIASVNLEYKSGELEYKYQLSKKNAISETKWHNSRIIGASLDGVVVEVDRDTVKVKILEGDNSTINKAAWLPYATVFSSPDGTGWYCMPEIGDFVRVYFPNEIEDNCYVISSVHTNGGNMGAMRSNPDNKCIATKYGKQIELTPTDIKITNSNGMLICISDTDGIIMVSGEDINLNADGNISLISATDTVDICAAESIVLRQGENLITVADEITFKGKKIKMQ